MGLNAEVAESAEKMFFPKHKKSLRPLRPLRLIFTVET